MSSPTPQNTQAIPLIIVGGPTASGKSELALSIAETFQGAIINADSMQVYRELAILTACPGPSDRARAPHHLFGVLSVGEGCSVARWRAMALAAIEEVRAAGQLPVICGGTGLYIRALLSGLSPIPQIPAAIRAEGKRLLAVRGGAVFRADLARRDPVGAARLADGDTQRLLRRWEVLEATGRPLTDWHRQRVPGEAMFDPFTILIIPERAALYRACERRFLTMLEHGALAEVRALGERGFDPDLPGMKALGVADLAAHLAGQISREDAIERVSRETRRYAKRQTTWFRRQIQSNITLNEQFSERQAAKIFSEIRQFLLTRTD